MNDTIIPDADPGTFTPLTDGAYAVDWSTVYYEGEALPGADASQFKLINPDSDGDYAGDATKMYYDGNPISGADAPSFDDLGYGYAKDKNTLYYQGESVSEADAASFSVVPLPPIAGSASANQSYIYDAKDAHHTYCEGVVSTPNDDCSMQEGD
jgi:DKNYY family